MKLFALMFLSSGLIIVAGCTTAKPIEFEEEPITPVQTINQEEPTFEPEIPITTDEEIVTQPDTSL